MVSTDRSDARTRTIGARRPLKKNRRLMWWGSAVTAAAVVAVPIAGIAFAQSEDRTSHAPSAPAQPDAVNPAMADGQLCLRPVAAKISDLTARFSVPLPDSRMANSSNLTRSVMCGSDPTLEFGDIVVRYESGWNMTPQSFADSLASGYKRGSVVEIAGTPAFVDGHHDGLNSEVIGLVGVTSVTIGSSPTASAEELEDVFASIVAASS
jgi:hypothetical protein